METALREEFSRNNFAVEDDAVAEQCAAMCVTFAMKPADFVSNWEVFYLNRQLDGGQVPSALMTGFKQFLLEEQKEAFRQKQKKIGFHMYTSNNLDVLLDDGEDEPLQQITPPRSLSTASKRITTPGINTTGSTFDADLVLVAPKTPAAGHKSAREAPRPKREDSPVTPFSSRQVKYDIVLAFNEALKEQEDIRAEADSEDDVLRRLRPIERCEVEVLTTFPKPGCRFMNDRVEDRFLAMERRIRRFADALMASEHCKVSHNVAVASQEQIIVVGRICCDGEGRLNDKSVLLEGRAAHGCNAHIFSFHGHHIAFMGISVEYSGGQRVRLDLRNVPQFSLFPGQVIGVEGHNPSGYCLVASRLIDTLSLSASPESPELLEPPSKRHEGAHIKLETIEPVVPQQVTIVMAAGPYSASDNLYFEPLADLLTYARRKRPRLLVLMGPFVDSEHPLIKQGLVEKTFKQIFQEEVRARVMDYIQEMGDGARVLLIPSCRDAHHDCVFPQPPFSMEGFDDEDNQISVLANPSIVRCDEVTLGCCTVDVLRHLSSEELPRCPVGSDRMTRLASHIIAQRSFYPLFPPPPGTSLDLSLVPEALSISEVPDILMVPSDLAPFVKVLANSSLVKSEMHKPDVSVQSPQRDSSSSSLCINPGRLTKGRNAGTFSEILILPKSGPITDNIGDQCSSPLSTRSKVVIRRL